MTHPFDPTDFLDFSSLIYVSPMSKITARLNTQYVNAEFQSFKMCGKTK